MVVRIPIYDLDVDGYSTLAGNIEGYHRYIKDLTYSVHRYGTHYTFIMKPVLPLYEPFEAKVTLNYREKSVSRSMLIDPGIEPGAELSEMPNNTKIDLQLEGLKTLEKDAVASFNDDKDTSKGNESESGFIADVNSHLVAKGDTLTMIAEKIFGMGGSHYQRVVALYRVNLSKFTNEDINILPVDSVILLPDSDQINNIAN